MLREIANSGLVVLVGRLVGAILAITTTLIVARFADPAISSKFIFFQNFAILLGTAGAAGLEQHGLRKIVEAQAEASGTALSAFLGSAYLSALLALLVTAFIGSLVLLPVFEQLGFGTHSPLAINLLVCGWGLSLSLRVLMSSLFRGIGLNMVGALSDGLIASVVSVTAIGTLVLLHQPLREAELVGIMVVANIAPCLFFITSIPRVNLMDQRLLAIILTLRNGLPLMVPTFISFTTMQAALVAGQRYGSYLDAAALGLAFQIFSGVSLAFVAAQVAAGPYIVRSYLKAKSRETWWAVHGFGLVAALPPLFVGIVFLLDDGWLLTAIAGQRFDGYSNVVAILCLGRGVQIGIGLNHTALVMGGQYKPYMLVQPLFLLVSVVFVVAGGQSGPSGIAVGFACSLVLQNIVLLGLVRRYRSSSPSAGMDGSAR